MRTCLSKEELAEKADHRDTARDAARYPAYIVIPMVAEGDSVPPVGVFEVESRQSLTTSDVVELTACASVLACAKLLDPEHPEETQ